MSGHAAFGNLPESDSVRREANRRRAAKSREKRQQAGQARISAWMPQERAGYARQVLQALAAGRNVLPPDPEQEATVAALRTELDQVQALAMRREGELTVERDAANGRAHAAERERDAARCGLRAAEAVLARAHAEAERFQEAPGLRGRVIRWLASRAGAKSPADCR